MKDIYKKELYDKHSLGVRPSKMKDADDGLSENVQKQ